MEFSEEFSQYFSLMFFSNFLFSSSSSSSNFHNYFTHMICEFSSPSMPSFQVQVLHGSHSTAWLHPCVSGRFATTGTPSGFVDVQNGQDGRGGKEKPVLIFLVSRFFFFLRHGD